MSVVFLINVQVVGSFSLLIVLGFIILALYWRKKDGYYVSRDIFALFSLFMLYAASSALLAGFQLRDTAYFYLVQRLFSLPALLFLFFAILKYPLNEIPPEYKKETQVFTAFLGGQMLLNAGLLVALIFFHVDQPPVWLDLTRNILLSSVPVWLAFLAHRRARDFHSRGDLHLSAFMRRAFIVFLAASGVLVVITTRNWLPFSAEYHSIVGVQGVMILIAVISFSFFNLQRNQSSLVTRASIVIILLIFLTLDFVAYFIVSSLPPEENARLFLYREDHILRPVILAQALLAAVLFFLAPRIIRAILPDDSLSLLPPVLFVEPALTPRQREVLRLLAEDMTNQQIAVSLQITERTAKHHLTSLLKLMGKQNRYELGKVARDLMKAGKL